MWTVIGADRGWDRQGERGSGSARSDMTTGAATAGWWGTTDAKLSSVFCWQNSSVSQTPSGRTELTRKPYFPTIRRKNNERVYFHTWSTKSQYSPYAQTICCQSHNAQSVQLMEHLVQLTKVVLKHFDRILSTMCHTKSVWGQWAQPELIFQVHLLRRLAVNSFFFPKVY